MTARSEDFATVKIEIEEEMNVNRSPDLSLDLARLYGETIPNPTAAESDSRNDLGTLHQTNPSQAQATHGDSSITISLDSGIISIDLKT
jgi:hypothetical protein